MAKNQDDPKLKKILAENARRAAGRPARMRAIAAKQQLQRDKNAAFDRKVREHKSRMKVLDAKIAKIRAKGKPSKKPEAKKKPIGGPKGVQQAIRSTRKKK